MALPPIEVVHDVVDVVVHTLSEGEILGIRDERHPEVWGHFLASAVKSWTASRFDGCEKLWRRQNSDQNRSEAPISFLLSTTTTDIQRPGFVFVVPCRLVGYELALASQPASGMTRFRRLPGTQSSSMHHRRQ